MKTKTAANSLLTALAAGLALVLVNGLVCGARAKVDLTEQKIFTLSDASVRMVQALPERVIVKAYFGNVPAEHAEKQQYVENLLAEYAGSSGGKLTWEKIDPWNNPDLQKELEKDGISQLLLISLKEDRQEQVPAYFAVKFSYLGKTEVWGPDPRYGFSIEGLEYEFTSRIKRLAYGKKKVGVTTGFGEPPQAQALAHPQVGLGDLYEVQTIDWATRPADVEQVDVLIVNGPTNQVSEAAQYHLDQHVMKGKPALLLVRGFRWQGGDDAPSPLEHAEQPWVGTPADHGLGPLLAHWGFEVGKDVIVDPRDTAPDVLAMGQQAIRIYGFAPVAEALAAGRHEPLEGIDYLALPFPSTVKLVGPLAAGTIEGGTVKPLLKTGPASFAKGDVTIITREMKLAPPRDGHGPYTVGYAATGKFRSFFADKPRPAGAGPAADAQPDKAPPDALASEPPAGETVKESPTTASVIVVGGSTFAEDRMFQAMQMLRTNLYVNGFVGVRNMVDWLVQDRDLARVRTKDVARPLRRLEKGERLAVKWGNVVGAPLALVAFGVVTWRLRVRRRRHLRL